MASQTQGIQQLLAAEKRAAEKVAEARKRKYMETVFFFFSFYISISFRMPSIYDFIKLHTFTHTHANTIQSSSIRL